MNEAKWAEKVIVYTDGASRGNPGAASIGIHIIDVDKHDILKHGECLPDTTNNVAEYTAVLRALEMCKANKVSSVIVRSDSELLVRQLQGQYKVKSPNLIGLYKQVLALKSAFKQIEFEHVRREFNKIADELANLALDGGL